MRCGKEFRSELDQGGGVQTLVVPSQLGVVSLVTSRSQTPAEAWEGVHRDVGLTQPAHRFPPPTVPRLAT